MTEPAATTSVDDWIGIIAEKAKAAPDEVRAALDRHGIIAQSTLPRRRRLCVSTISLRGIKTTSSGATDIDFDWKDLGPGLWALLSDDNFQGKSSLINIIYAALRGEFPLYIKPDVWSWLSDLSVDFMVEQTLYRVEVSKPVGIKDADLARGVLSRLDGDTWLDVYSGTAGNALAQAVADNMMEEFSFGKFFAHNKDDGTHTHGWHSIASSFFVTGPGKAVFGEVVHDGMPLRLLQLFMGLPWITTYSAAASAYKKVLTARERVQAPSPVKQQLATRLAVIEGELGRARKALSDRVDRVALRRNLVAGDRLLVSLQTKVEEERDRVADLERQALTARRSAGEVRRTLQQMTDERAAGLVFRELRPVCCPSCDTGIDSRRYHAADAGATCALCGAEHVEADDEASMLDDLKEEAREAEAVAARLEAELGAAKRRRGANEIEREAAQRTVEDIKSELASPEDADAEIRVGALEAQVAQLKEIIDEQSPQVAVPATDDAEILKHAAKVTKDLYDDMQRDLLKEVSGQLLRLCTEFGIKNLTDLNWTGNGAINITQGGTDLTFGSLAAGEKLRLRIAAALAVIEVARNRHYGRYPGLLVLDSPAAQEMAEEDFAALLASVLKVVNQSEDVQVIVGARARPELLGVVESQRRLHAKGGRFLF